MKHRSLAIIILSVICMMLTLFSVFVIHREGYIQKALVKLGLQDREVPVNYAVSGWTNCLMKLDYDADIVFFGDSITTGSDFREFFDNVTICNLGYSGDTLEGMKNRVQMISAVTPEKIFVLGGINGLTKFNIDKSIQTYSELLDLIREANPNADIYVQSVLPVSSEKNSSLWLNDDTIELFNDKLQKLVDEKNMVYVDIYSAYVLNGELNPEYTKDGVHIPNHYSPWANVISKYII